jgi:predicted nucleic acid-binding protein
MNDKIFVDTNVLIYLYSNDDEIKKDKAFSAITKSEILISTQVLIEFTNIGLRKLKLSPDAINGLIDELESYFEIYLNTAHTIKKAIRIVDVYKYSWFDSLIIAAALESDCAILLSEDMQHKQLIENKLTIINPFL